MTMKDLSKILTRVHQEREAKKAFHTVMEKASGMLPSKIQKADTITEPAGIVVIRWLLILRTTVTKQTTKVVQNIWNEVDENFTGVEDSHLNSDRHRLKPNRLTLD
jgi:hypothetical protein